MRNFADKIINEGYDEGGRLIEMGEFDPMYPEAPESMPEDEGTQIVSMDCGLLRGLLEWAGADPTSVENVVNKAKELGSEGTLTADRLVDLTGAADYQQPGQTDQPEPIQQVSGIVSPVLPSGPISPVMESYLKRMKKLQEGTYFNPTVDIEACAEELIEELKAKYEDSEIPSILQDKLDEVGNDPETVAIIEKAIDFITYTEEDDDEPAGSDAVEFANTPEEGEEEEDYDDEDDDTADEESEDEESEEDDEEGGKIHGPEVEKEIGDIDIVANTLQGAIRGAEEAIDDAAPGALDTIDPNVLDADQDGENVLDQIDSIKARIHEIEVDLGLAPEGEIEAPMEPGMEMEPEMGEPEGEAPEMGMEPEAEEGELEGAIEAPEMEPEAKVDIEDDEDEEIEESDAYETPTLSDLASRYAQMELGLTQREDIEAVYMGAHAGNEFDTPEEAKSDPEYTKYSSNPNFDIGFKFGQEHEIPKTISPWQRRADDLHIYEDEEIE